MAHKARYNRGDPPCLFYGKTCEALGHIPTCGGDFDFCDDTPKAMRYFVAFEMPGGLPLLKREVKDEGMY